MNNRWEWMACWGATDGWLADWWIPLIILLVIGIAFFLYLLSLPRTFPYERIESLCTRTELRFYHELAQVVNNEFQIFGKTRIADLLKVKKGTQKRMSWQNRINSKHIDFILCDPRDLRILVAIELDDESHQRPDRIARDQFVNQAFADARLPILRIKTRKTYDRDQIRRAIDQAVKAVQSGDGKRQPGSWVYHLD